MRIKDNINMEGLKEENNTEKVNNRKRKGLIEVGVINFRFFLLLKVKKLVMY